LKGSTQPDSPWGSNDQLGGVDRESRYDQFIKDLQLVASLTPEPPQLDEQRVLRFAEFCSVELPAALPS